MQKSIIESIELFAFDSTSAKQQAQIEFERLRGFLGQSMPAKQAIEKYNRINQNVKAYFLQNYNINL